MTIVSFTQIIDFLKAENISFKLIGTAQDSYELASLIAPIENGFYFFTGQQTPKLKNALVLSNLPEDITDSNNAHLIIKENPQRVYYKFSQQHFGRQSNGRINSLTSIDPKARIGKNVQIDPFCVIGDCEIQDNCIIASHTVIHDNTIIEKDCIIEAHSVIGTQGLAWIWDDQTDSKIIQPQLGGVLIKEACFLGAQTVIVRGSINEKTTVGKHTIIAPGARLGHGTQIGDYVHFANNIVTGGNVKIGDYSFVGSMAVFRPKTRIHPFTIVGSGAVVIKDTTQEGMTLISKVSAKEFETKNKPSGMPEPKLTK